MKKLIVLLVVLAFAAVAGCAVAPELGKLAQKETVVGCEQHEDCAPSWPLCHPKEKFCVDCITDVDCDDNQICSQTTYKCVAKPVDLPLQCIDSEIAIIPCAVSFTKPSSGYLMTPCSPIPISCTMDFETGCANYTSSYPSCLKDSSSCTFLSKMNNSCTKECKSRVFLDSWSYLDSDDTSKGLYAVCYRSSPQDLIPPVYRLALDIKVSEK